jgi:DNA-binding transcriptional LysR family regulator
MDLRQITYFMWVFEHGSFTKAAQKAGVVQPALSIQVKRLEEELGVSLFVRNSRGVAPTSFGERFYSLCEPILRDVAMARSKMLELINPDVVMGTLRCGFPSPFFKAVIGPVVSRFTQANPHMTLHLREGYGRTLTQWVSDGALDFAIGAWSIDMPGLTVSMVYEEEVVLISGRALPMRDFSICNPEALTGLKLILPSARQILAPQLEQLISTGRVRPASVMHVDSYMGVVEIARQAGWAGFVPISGVSGDMLGTDLHVYRFPKQMMYLRWHLVHRAGEELHPGAQRFIGILEQALKEDRTRFLDMGGMHEDALARD